VNARTLPQFQPPRTAAAQDESWAQHGDNAYMRFIHMGAFAARLERELATAQARVTELETHLQHLTAAPPAVATFPASPPAAARVGPHHLSQRR